MTAKRFEQMADTTVFLRLKSTSGPLHRSNLRKYTALD